MQIHLSREDVLELICKKFNIPYEILRDEKNTYTEFVIKDKSVMITWEGSTITTEQVK